MTGPDSHGISLVAPQLVVPAYFHPAVRPQDWESLAERASKVRIVVLNPGTGPGDEPDDTFTAPLRRLRDVGVQVVGYVDTHYGRRSAAEIRGDIERYNEWYGVSGFFLDRVPAGAGDVDHYARLARDAREAGAQVVAFNHGVYPVEAYAEHADLLGTFEGTWNSYIDVTVPRWARARPTVQFFHLVYSVPKQSFGTAFLLAARRRAGCVYVTDHAGANPWDRLPASEFSPRL